MKPLFEQIGISVNINDLDEAIRTIQEILGQEDGGNASIFFLDCVDGERWPQMTDKAREWTLIRYVVFELGMRKKGL